MKVQPATQSVQAGRVTPCAASKDCTKEDDFAASAAGGGLPALPRRGGFTLLEVMFAMIVFCTAMFSILALVSQSLEMARRLQRPMVDAGLVASELSLTNIFVEGTKSDDLGHLLGDAYRGYTYDYAIDEVETNKLFQAVIVIQKGVGSGSVVSKMTVLYYRPDSPAGSLDGGNFTP
jgi:hypothetical protein